MMQIVEMSYEDKVKMYEKCSREELIKMLIECNKYLERLLKTNAGTNIIYPQNFPKE